MTPRAGTLLGGMATASAGTVQRLERLGTGLLSPEQGLAALGAVIAGGHGFDGCGDGGGGGGVVMTVSRFDWPRLLRQQPSAAIAGVLSELAEMHHIEEDEQPLPALRTEATGADAAAEAAAMDIAALEAIVSAETAAILGGRV